ncbi:hypothetical protein Tco_1093521 [Tanacetum coccineum]|uniref:Uncharacterized protein n=1 Tax=Tanacetum coccineum TaxID=301880 RepID=A0ABQ5IF81_9ASTR
MACTQASSSNPSKKLKLTIIPPRKLFVDLTQEDDYTHTPSPLAKSLSPSQPNAPSKTPSTKETSATFGTISTSFESKPYSSPLSSRNTPSPQPTNPFIDNPLDDLTSLLIQSSLLWQKKGIIRRGTDMESMAKNKVKGPSTSNSFDALNTLNVEDKCETSSSRADHVEDQVVRPKVSQLNEHVESDEEVDEFIFPEGDKFGDKFDIRLKGRVRK